MENDLSHILFSKPCSLFVSDKGRLFLGLPWCRFQLQYEASDWNKLKRTALHLNCLLFSAVTASEHSSCTYLPCVQKSDLHVRACCLAHSKTYFALDLKPKQRPWRGPSISSAPRVRAGSRSGCYMSLSRLLVWSYAHPEPPERCMHGLEFSLSDLAE